MEISGPLVAETCICKADRDEGHLAVLAFRRQAFQRADQYSGPSQDV